MAIYLRSLFCLCLSYGCNYKLSLFSQQRPKHGLSKVWKREACSCAQKHHGRQK